MKKKPNFISYIILFVVSVIWAVPLIWTIVTTFRPRGMATSINFKFAFTLENIKYVLESAPFLKYGLNTIIIVFGILIVQFITITLGAFALARIDFIGKNLIFSMVMIQIIVPIDVLIMPNYLTLRDLKLVDTRLGVMIPYFASAMGLLLLRQAFKSIPRSIEDSAKIDGANTLQTIWHIFIPSCKTSYISFAIISISAHWNNFLWPMIVINSVDKRPLTMGLALFAKANEGGPMWSEVASATFITMLPLLVLFIIFQKQFVESFISSGIK